MKKKQEKPKRQETPTREETPKTAAQPADTASPTFPVPQPGPQARPTRQPAPEPSAPEEPATEPVGGEPEALPVITITPTNSSSPLRIILFAALGLAGLFLLLAAVPPWLARGGRTTMALATWRGQIAAVGVSALFAAALVFIVSKASP